MRVSVLGSQLARDEAFSEFSFESEFCQRRSPAWLGGLTGADGPIRIDRVRRCPKKASYLRRLIRFLAHTDVRRNVTRMIYGYNKAPDFSCPCCGHRGRFDLWEDSGRLNQECPSCHSQPRQRLIALALRDGFLSFAGRDILHIAPEGLAPDRACKPPTALRNRRSRCWACRSRSRHRSGRFARQLLRPDHLLSRAGARHR